MAKRQANPEARMRWFTSIRPYVLPVLAATLAMLVALLAFQKTEQFLIHNERFAMRPGGPGEPDSPDLRITGLSRTPADQVRGVFHGDERRSVFLVPLAERRDQLQRIQWVRNATVSRLWPNRIDVRVTERTPAAFVRLPGNRRGAPSVPAMIDIDGVILPSADQRGPFELPVLAGIHADQPVAARALRVRRMRGLLGELGPLAEKVAEVDGKDAENWKITMEIEDRAVTLILGNGEFGKKVTRFFQHWWRRKRATRWALMPAASGRGA
jgi:cell division protein FtsQ